MSRYIYKTNSWNILKYVMKNNTQSPIFWCIDLKWWKNSFYCFIWDDKERIYKISSLRLFTENLTENKIKEVFDFDNYNKLGFKFNLNDKHTEDSIKKDLKEYLTKMWIIVKEGEIDKEIIKEEEIDFNKEKVLKSLEEIQLEVSTNKLHPELKKLEDITKNIFLVDGSNFFTNLDYFNQETSSNEILQEKTNENNKTWMILKNILGVLLNNSNLKKDYETYKYNLWKKDLKNYSKELIAKDLKEIKEMSEELKKFYYNVEFIYETLNKKWELKKLHEGLEIKDIGLEEVDDFKINFIEKFLDGTFSIEETEGEVRDSLNDKAYELRKGDEDKQEEIFKKLSDEYFEKNNYLKIVGETRELENVKLWDFLKLLDNFNKITLTEGAFKEEWLKEKFNLMLDSIKYVKEMLKSSLIFIKENKEYQGLIEEKNKLRLQENLIKLKNSYESIKELKTEEEKKMFEKESKRLLKELKKTNFLFILNNYNYDSLKRKEIEKLEFNLKEDQKELIEKLKEISIIQQKIKNRMNNEKIDALKKKDIENIEITIASI